MTGPLLQDLRFALRGVRRAPGFALSAILSLALGIGATTTAIFSVADALLLRRRILSLEMFPIVGICILLLDSQLFDGRFWRSSSPADMADLGAGRKHHRRAAVSILFAIVLRLVEREGRFSPELAGPARRVSSPSAQSRLSLETERTR